MVMAIKLCVHVHATDLGELYDMNFISFFFFFVGLRF
jgi:hypothetical protein